jgi:hypothetical protein
MRHGWIFHGVFRIVAIGERMKKFRLTVIDEWSILSIYNDRYTVINDIAVGHSYARFAAPLDDKADRTKEI